MCNDSFAECEANKPRHDRLKALLNDRRTEAARKIVCLPSHTQYGDRDYLAKHWQGSYVVFANSYKQGTRNDGFVGSFIARVDEWGKVDVLELENGESTNVVKVADPI